MAHAQITIIAQYLTTIAVVLMALRDQRVQYVFAAYYILLNSPTQI